MNRMPPEILLSILEIVTPEKGDRISAYAAISRQWQAVVESITFRSLTVTPSALEAFQEAFQGVNIWRREELRTINIQPIFPKSTFSDTCCQVGRAVDRDANREADSKAWSNFVAQLFTILGDVAHRSKDATRLLPPLSLAFLSAGRVGRRENDYGPLEAPSVHCLGAGDGEFDPHTRREVEAARPQPGTVELYGANELPSLADVSSVEWHVWGRSKNLRPTCLGQIAEKLPSLLKFELHLEDAYDWGCNWRRQYQLGVHCGPG
jgi:hypothetical protein